MAEMTTELKNIGLKIVYNDILKTVKQFKNKEKIANFKNVTEEQYLEMLKTMKMLNGKIKKELFTPELEAEILETQSANLLNFITEKTNEYKKNKEKEKTTPRGWSPSFCKWIKQYLGSSESFLKKECERIVLEELAIFKCNVCKKATGRIESVELTLNFNGTVVTENEILTIKTIQAWGEIQRPHYRTLIKVKKL